ncbi:MAG: rhombosortase, partial [Gammaproteobacteria bacterium]|nr:rhombosortase [Gammaproteobacteria bacterium]
EWWRLVSGHIVHLGWSHVLLNLAGLTLVVLLFPREYRAGQWWILTLACIGSISAGFVLLRPDLSWYVGLSGVLHGYFVAGAIRWISRQEPEGYVLGVFLAGKLGWEQLNGALPWSVSSSGGPVVVDAHLYGAIAGGVIALFFLRDWNSLRR